MRDRCASPQSFSLHTCTHPILYFAGFDCADCGRAFSVSRGATHDDDDHDDRRRRLRLLEAPQPQPTRRETLPSLQNVEATMAFVRTIRRGIQNGTIAYASLPKPHTELLEQLR